MEIDRIAFMEHLAFRSRLRLHEVCRRLADALSLPPFAFDAENATEWGPVEVDGVEVNVSRPYKPGTLQAWDGTAPPGCNFGVILIVAKGHPDYPDHQHAVERLVPSYGQRIADTLNTDVYHHRLWLGVGNHVPLDTLFRPQRQAP